MAQPTIYTLFGPTASGKTSLSITLARHLEAEIINADSRQIYADCPILSAVPTPEEQANIPHHLFSVIPLTTRYSAAQYLQDATKAAHDIIQNGKTPLFVGGTGFYLQALAEGLSPVPNVPAEIEEVWMAKVQAEGPAALHQRLQQVDASLAQKLEAGDTQRLVRALSVWEATDKPLSEWQAQPKEGALPYKIVKLALAPPREVIQQNIKKRFDEMLAAGLLEEVKGAMEKYDDINTLPGKTLHGLRELTAHLNGDMSLEEAQESIITQTAQYAKRQMTWLRNSYGADVVGETAEEVLQKISSM